MVRSMTHHYYHLFILLPLLALCGCAELDAQRDQIANQDRTIKKLRDENKQFQDAYYKIKDQYDNQNTQSQKSVDQLARDLEQARNLRTQREKELADQLRTRNLEFDALKNLSLDQKGQLEGQIAQLQHNLQLMTGERDAGLVKLKDSDNKLRAEQARSTDLTQQVAQFKTDVKALNDQIAGLQKDVADRDTALKTEKDARLGIEKQLAGVTKQLADAEKQRAGAESKLAAQDKQLQETQGQLAAAQKKIDAGVKAQAALEQLKKEKDALASEMAATKNSHEQELKSVKVAKGQVSLAEDPELKKQAAALEQKFKGSAKGVKVKLDGHGLHVTVPSSLLFDENKTTLGDRASGVLSPIAAALNQIRERPVEIVGHTDDQVPQDLPYADNWGLGFARADRVREFLMKDGGVSASRLTALSRAQYEPLASNDTPEGRKQNRRVEIVVGGK